MQPIEEMRAFFAARVTGYDEHMLTNIEGLPEAYDRMATLLPDGIQTLLDLGCGTGLELAPIFARFPALHVTGIDMTPEMLAALEHKYANHAVTLICGSYFDVDFGLSRYDAAVSFETLHHFTYAEKMGLYRRLLHALKPGGTYIEADFVAASQEEENSGFLARAKLLHEKAAKDGLWHVDTPLTIESQMRLLSEAGFADVHLDWQCANTVILVARAG